MGTPCRCCGKVVCTSKEIRFDHDRYNYDDVVGFSKVTQKIEHNVDGGGYREISQTEVDCPPDNETVACNFEVVDIEQTTINSVPVDVRTTTTIVRKFAVAISINDVYDWGEENSKGHDFINSVFIRGGESSTALPNSAPSCENVPGSGSGVASARGQLYVVNSNGEQLPNTSADFDSLANGIPISFDGLSQKEIFTSDVDGNGVYFLMVECTEENSIAEWGNWFGGLVTDTILIELRRITDLEVCQGSQSFPALQSHDINEPKDLDDWHQSFVRVADGDYRSIKTYMDTEVNFGEFFATDYVEKYFLFCGKLNFGFFNGAQPYLDTLYEIAYDRNDDQLIEVAFPDQCTGDNIVGENTAIKSDPITDPITGETKRISRLESQLGAAPTEIMPTECPDEGCDGKYVDATYEFSPEEDCKIHRFRYKVIGGVDRFNQNDYIIDEMRTNYVGCQKIKPLSDSKNDDTCTATYFSKECGYYGRERSGIELDDHVPKKAIRRGPNILNGWFIRPCVIESSAAAITTSGPATRRIYNKDIYQQYLYVPHYGDYDPSTINFRIFDHEFYPHILKLNDVNEECPKECIPTEHAPEWKLVNSSFGGNSKATVNYTEYGTAGDGATNIHKSRSADNFNCGAVIKSCRQLQDCMGSYAITDAFHMKVATYGATQNTVWALGANGICHYPRCSSFHRNDDTSAFPHLTNCGANSFSNFCGNSGSTDTSLFEQGTDLKIGSHHVCEQGNCSVCGYFPKGIIRDQAGTASDRGADKMLIIDDTFDPGLPNIDMSLAEFHHFAGPTSKPGGYWCYNQDLAYKEADSYEEVGCCTLEFEGALEDVNRSNITKHVCENILPGTIYNSPGHPNDGRRIKNTDWNRDDLLLGCCPRVEGCCKVIYDEDGDGVEDFRTADDTKTKEECDAFRNQATVLNTIWNKGECREFGFCCDCELVTDPQCTNPTDDICDCPHEPTATIRQGRVRDDILSSCDPNFENPNNNTKFFTQEEVDDCREQNPTNEEEFIQCLQLKADAKCLEELGQDCCSIISGGCCTIEAVDGDTYTYSDLTTREECASHFRQFRVFGDGQRKFVAEDPYFVPGSGPCLGNDPPGPDPPGPDPPGPDPPGPDPPVGPDGPDPPDPDDDPDVDDPDGDPPDPDGDPPDDGGGGGDGDPCKCKDTCKVNLIAIWEGFSQFPEHAVKEKKFYTQCRLNPNHKHCEHSGGPGYYHVAPTWNYHLEGGGKIPCEGFGHFCPPPFDPNGGFCQNNKPIPCGCELPNEITEEELKAFRDFVDTADPFGGCWNGCGPKVVDGSTFILQRTKPCGEGPNGEPRVEGVPKDKQLCPDGDPPPDGPCGDADNPCGCCKIKVRCASDGRSIRDGFHPNSPMSRKECLETLGDQLPEGEIIVAKWGVYPTNPNCTSGSIMARCPDGPGGDGPDGPDDPDDPGGPGGPDGPDDPDDPGGPGGPVDPDIPGGGGDDPDDPGGDGPGGDGPGGDDTFGCCKVKYICDVKGPSGQDLIRDCLLGPMKESECLNSVGSRVPEDSCGKGRITFAKWGTYPNNPSCGSENPCACLKCPEDFAGDGPNNPGGGGLGGDGPGGGPVKGICCRCIRNPAALCRNPEDPCACNTIETTVITGNSHAENQQQCQADADGNLGGVFLSYTPVTEEQLLDCRNAVANGSFVGTVDQCLRAKGARACREAQGDNPAAGSSCCIGARGGGQDNPGGDDDLNLFEL